MKKKLSRLLKGVKNVLICAKNQKINQFIAGIRGLRHKAEQLNSQWEIIVKEYVFVCSTKALDLLSWSNPALSKQLVQLQYFKARAREGEGPPVRQSNKTMVDPALVVSQY